MPVSKNGVSTVITKSLKTAKPFFILSAFPTSELDQIAIQRTTTWQKQNGTGNGLAVISLGLPWAEHPAHALFAQIIEQWKPEQLRDVVRNALGYWGDDAPKITVNAHLADVLKGIINPGHGNRESWEQHSLVDSEKILRNLHRTYLLDATSQASDRRKLGYARALTTQDRYELLVCLFRCQQGLDSIARRTRIWLTLDQTEHILDYTPAEQRQMVHGLAMLISQLSEYFTFWLNIADPNPEIVAQVEKICGTLFWQWLDFEFTEYHRSGC